MAVMSAPAENSGISRPGGKMLCPGCEEEGDFFYAFKPLDFNAKFKRDLNPIYKHRKDRGGCGHVFSPGDPQVMALYISGDMVPRSMVTTLEGVITELTETIKELRAADTTSDAERRPVST